MELTVQQFDAIASLIYEKSGLRFDILKQYLVSKRVADRMTFLGITNPDEYILYLTRDVNKTEFQLLVNTLTTNESYFFRDYLQLESFAEYCLPEMALEKSATGNYKLRIWTAGCSSGEEPYTLAIILHEILGDIADWQIEIYATDIDERILNTARIGVYNARSVKDVSAVYLKKYFTEKNGSYYVSSQIKSMVHFELQNINDQSRIRKMRDFDFVFCRNVLIYFDEVSRKRAVDNFYISLNKGGYIFLGSSESIGRISNAFVLKRKGSHLVYKKESV